MRKQKFVRMRKSLDNIVQRWCPLAWEAFVDYRLKSLALSRIEMDIIRALAQGDSAQAIALARGAALLPATDEPLRRNRERDELESKLIVFGLPIPWADGR